MKRLFNVFLLGILGVLVLFMVALLISNLTEQREREQAKEKLREQQLDRYGEELMALCKNVQPVPTGEFPLITAILHPLVLQRGSSHAHQVHERLPADRYPQSRAEVDLVLCLDKPGVGEKVEIDRCPYKGTGRVAILYRVDPEVIAIDPVSKQVIAMGKLAGSNPGNCPFRQKGKPPRLLCPDRSP